MKAVLISIRPEWCDKIASGEKTIEIRKNKPNIDLPFKCYIYETKAINHQKIIVDLDGELPTTYARGRGKVIGEFICDRIEYLDMDSAGVGFWENGEFKYIKDIGWNACLTRNEFLKYSNGKKLYGWHISKPVIYDKPKELSDFNKRCPNNYECIDCAHLDPWDYPWDIAGSICGLRFKRPPQSWCYVEEASDGKL